MAFPLLALLPALEKVLDRVIPDKTAAAAAKMELYKMEHEGEFRRAELDLRVSGAQTDINKVEAGSGLFFVAGWRPAVGWVCVATMATNFLAVPLLSWLSHVLGIEPPPSLKLDDLWPVLMGMLGLGAMRTVEKLKGVEAGMTKK